MQLWKTPPLLRMVMISPRHRTRYADWHHHPFYEIGVVLAGRCTWRFGTSRRVTLRSGEALLLKPRIRHREEIEPSDEAQIAWIGFDFDGLPPTWCHRNVALDDDAAEITGYFEAIAREHHLADARTQARIDLALQSLLLLLDRRAEVSQRPAAAGSVLNARQTQTVESAAHYFRNNLRHPLSIAQVAAYHSLCPAHFSSLFQRHHRLTPRSFLRLARLQHAADLLTGSELPLKEIALQSGFVDAAHLCKSFRQDHRVTPGRFRAQSRKNRLPVLG